MSKLFQREVYCVLGVPIDCVTLAQAADVLNSAMARGERLLLATPNLNFAIMARDDPAFRSAVVNSDLSVADGMPLVWVAKSMGVPLTQRVAGSDLIDLLARQARTPPAEIYFFGGDEDAGARACDSLNRRSAGGIHACGSFYPGFGSLEEMSNPEIIATVNRSNPDILAVALGAKKGLAWIERNRADLNARVISHLGAVINFFAGSVRRAPRWMQKTGLEWIWRIVQEPKLWRRYWHDGATFLGLLLTRVLPFLIWSKLRRQKPHAGDSASCDFIEQSELNLIRIAGRCESDTLAPIRAAFDEAAAAKRGCILDLSGVSQIDSAFIGQILLLCKALSGKDLVIANPSASVRKIIRWNCAEFLLDTGSP